MKVINRGMLLFLHVCVMRYYSVIKKNEVDLCVWRWEEALDILPRGAN